MLPRRALYGTYKSTLSFCNAIKPYSQSSDDVLSRIKMEPIKRVNESIDTMRSRLIYQSRKRGILETDLLLSGFAAKNLKNMGMDQLKEYDAFLNELDWDIYYWITQIHNKEVPERWKNSEILQKLRDFCKNEEKKILRMPNLENF
ncbi:hypothetical protein KAFR_0C01130 [Kazachstania africana CBS 2517]|uniref:Succinate dehydrogenase assembly factor 2, mitochondrial n=1 Tax=Kazachstania africana (strain ATCC 22294 / BCRC 22015 / CBS 2517 / CECT 1963 / NBRC 1671 / NRRL Y-8276) TaxID=1071382 RepID=H2ARV8_KAZAF|nr:hypothetical protein KAFR_0C01130 [Kazachstania africana CBS 2517]CCF57108.1 hypothetical protein KAFR_0C01130 [Kazachstania africana CBS 2517]